MGILSISRFWADGQREVHLQNGPTGQPGSWRPPSQIYSPAKMVKFVINNKSPSVINRNL